MTLLRKLDHDLSINIFQGISPREMCWSCSYHIWAVLTWCFHDNKGRNNAYIYIYIYYMYYNYKIYPKPTCVFSWIMSKYTLGNLQSTSFPWKWTLESLDKFVADSYLCIFLGCIIYTIIYFSDLMYGWREHKHDMTIWPPKSWDPSNSAQGERFWEGNLADI